MITIDPTISDTGAWAELNLELNAGESETIGLNHLIGVSAMVSASVTISGTADVEYRYASERNPQEGDWTPWMPGALGYGLDSDKPLFIEIKITAIDDCDVVALNIVTECVTYEPDAIWNEENIYTQLPEIIGQIVLSFAPTIRHGIGGTRPAFQFVSGNPEQCVKDWTIPAVYLYNPRITESLEMGNEVQKSVQFELGIRRDCNKDHETNFNTMRGKISARFGRLADYHTYDVVIDGLLYRGVNLNRLGLQEFRAISGGAERTPPDAKCGNTWWMNIFDTKINYTIWQQVSMRRT